MKKFIIVILISLAPISALAGVCSTVGYVDSTPTARFSAHGDGTVTDKVTGLMWKVCSEGQSYNASTGGCDGVAVPMSWDWALKVNRVDTTSLGFAFDNMGQTAWRLPNIKELASIVARQCTAPAINEEIFPATPLNVRFWSSTPWGNMTYEPWAMTIESNEGHDRASVVSSSLHAVRLVRDSL